MRLRFPERLVQAMCGIAFLAAAGCARQPEIVPQRIDGEALSLAWTYDAGGPINQSPLRVGDVVIVVPAGGPLLALDVESGALRWKFDPAARVWDRAYATDGRNVYVGVAGGQLAALDARSGRLRWEQTLGIDVQHPPLVDGDTLYVPTTFVGTGLDNNPNGRAKLFALRARNGRELWAWESGNYILQTPFRQGDTLYTAGVFHDPDPVDEGGHTRIYALSLADQQVRWSYESGDGFPKSLYATDDTVTFIAYRDFVSGVDAATGELRWRRDTENWVPALSGVEDVLYFGSANTVVHALRADSGKVLWQHNIVEGTFNYMLGAPVRVEDDLYFLTQHGDIVALDARNGELLWSLSTGIAARVGLSVSGGRVFVGDAEGVVYAYTGALPEG